MGKRAKSLKKSDEEQTKDYIEFLVKRLASKNFKANVSEEEYQKTKDKLAKARLKIKLGL